MVGRASTSAGGWVTAYGSHDRGAGHQAPVRWGCGPARWEWRGVSAHPRPRTVSGGASRRARRPQGLLQGSPGRASRAPAARFVDDHVGSHRSGVTGASLTTPGGYRSHVSRIGCRPRRTVSPVGRTEADTADDLSPVRVVCSCLHRSRPSGTRSTREDLRLLRLELGLGEHPRLLQFAELLQLLEQVVGGRRGGRRHRRWGGTAVWVLRLGYCGGAYCEGGCWACIAAAVSGRTGPVAPRRLAGPSPPTDQPGAVTRGWTPLSRCRRWRRFWLFRG